MCDCGCHLAIELAKRASCDQQGVSQSTWPVHFAARLRALLRDLRDKLKFRSDGEVSEKPL